MISQAVKEKIPYLLGALVMILFLTGLVVYYRTRNKNLPVSGYLDMGKDNHNPGNIRSTNTFWKGENTVSGEAFESFISDELGFRAMFKLLANYVKNGYNTLDKIIHHYAPPSDNNPTATYINTVAAQVGLLKGDVLSLSLLTADNGKLFKAIVKSMSRFERGKTYSDSVIASGYQLYLNG